MYNLAQSQYSFCTRIYSRAAINYSISLVSKLHTVISLTIKQYWKQKKNYTDFRISQTKHKIWMKIQTFWVGPLDQVASWYSTGDLETGRSSELATWFQRFTKIQCRYYKCQDVKLLMSLHRHACTVQVCKIHAVTCKLKCKANLTLQWTCSLTEVILADLYLTSYMDYR